MTSSGAAVLSAAPPSRLSRLSAARALRGGAGPGVQPRRWESGSGSGAGLPSLFPACSARPAEAQCPRCAHRLLSVAPVGDWI